MKVILIYDVELKEPRDQKRLNKVRKIARRYLIHIQKSVFEGELTEGQIYQLEKEIKNEINPESDSVILYLVGDGVKVTRKILSNINDKTNNML